MGSLYRRLFWLVCLSIFLFVTSGCADNLATRSVSGEINRDGTGITKKDGQRIEGYTTKDGFYHHYDGKVALSGIDSLSFWRERDATLGDDFDQYNEYQIREKWDEFKLSGLSVSSLYVRAGSSTGSQVLMAFAVILGIVVVAGAITMATKESCPFIYSYDGEQYVFDGEPYGGATMSSLARTDASELEHLEPVDGEYRLLLTNEVDETQHTDQIEIVAVDHPRGTLAVMDLDGQPHSFGRLTGLIGAHDETGNDLMVWLREDDRSAWYPDLEYYVVQDSLADTRNHITLEFPRPAGQDSLYLVSNVSTGQWGSHMIRVMLGMRGNEVQDFYDAINNSPDYQKQLRAWNEREELFLLGVEVQEGEDWVRRGELHGGGPFISERRAVPLDISGVEGDTIRLRVHPPIGFWSLNSFHLASDEQSVTATSAAFVSATDQDGLDVRPLLVANDGATLDFPTTREHAELIFAPPPLQANGVRTVFARTTGWYEIHLYNDGPPETAGLMRLANEPGYIVHRAMQEFSEYQTTGVLGYAKSEMVAP